MGRILAVRQIKPICLGKYQFVFPKSEATKIILDTKRQSHKKQHQLIYQQDPRRYGTVGDCCNYLSNEELFYLEEKGMIKIKRGKHKD